MSTVIRNATTDDLQYIVAIYNDIIKNTFAVWSEKTVDIDNRRVWMENRQEAGYPILVAILNSEVIGYGSFGPFSSSIHDTFTNHGLRHTVELTVHIDRNHRRKGIGRALVQALIDEAKKQPNIHVLVAGIAAVNTASISLFESFGFKIVAKMPETGLKHGKWLDDVLMQKIL